MVKIQKQEEAKCKQETKQTFPTPGDGSSLSCGHGMMIFTRVPANHIKTSKCIKSIKMDKGTFLGEQR